MGAWVQEKQGPGQEGLCEPVYGVWLFSMKKVMGRFLTHVWSDLTFCKDPSGFRANDPGGGRGGSRAPKQGLSL